jgi:hypothetical protein
MTASSILMPALPSAAARARWSSRVTPPDKLRATLGVREHIGLQPLEQEHEDPVHELGLVPWVANPGSRKAHQSPHIMLLHGTNYILHAPRHHVLRRRLGRTELKTASVPATVSSTRAASKTSPSTTTSLSWLTGNLEGLRTSALTSRPSASARSTSGRPVLPEAPKIASLMPSLPPFSSRGSLPHRNPRHSCRTTVRLLDYVSGQLSGYQLAATVFRV